METSTTLIKPFLSGVYQDVRGLYPALSFSSSALELERILLYEDAPLVLELSKIGKSAERALISGEILDFGPLPFLQLAEGTGLPVFFFELWEELFFMSGAPRWVGESVDSVPPIRFDDQICEGVAQSRALALLCLRQFFSGFSKLGSIPSLADEESEIQGFKDRITATPEITCESAILGIARALLVDLFTVENELHPMLAQFASDPFGAHGPGAVSDGSRGRDKWTFDDMQGLPQNILRTPRTFLKQSGEEGIPLSKLAIVPKDFRGHRLICVEPKEFMFYQQGLMRVIYQLVDVHLPTSLCIDFNSQIRSFRVSRKTGLSTIDLKDASDYLSLPLAKLLLPKEVLRLATVARSRGVVLPDGEVVTSVTTLFTMGNALCFPFETLLFWALSLATMLYREHLGHIAASPWLLKGFLKRSPLRVFGDDIIVPKRYFEDVCLTLSRCGLKVNGSKSCCRTPVREACGSWYQNGIDCRIVRLKTHITKTEADWIGLLQGARFLWESGFLNASHAILSFLEAFIPVPYGIGWLPSKANYGGAKVRYNVQLQRLEARIPILKGVKADLLTGETGLYSYFVGKGSRMAPRHDILDVTWGWTDRV